MNVVAVGIGGFFGAILRYIIGEWIHTENGFPLGTLIINLAGCFFLDASPLQQRGGISIQS